VKTEKVVVLTNIPAPYRVEFFNDLNKKNFDFEVWYMRSTVSYRPGWSISPDKFAHPHFINNGVFFMFFSHQVFFNPRLIWRALRAGRIELILGSAWVDPDTVMIVLLKKIGLFKGNIHFWSEANYLTNGARKSGYLKKLFRRFIYDDRGTIQISSGEMTDLTLRHWGVPVYRRVFLPNTIQQDIFNLTESHLSQRRINDKPVIFISARLIERLKGIINFFDALEVDEIQKLSFVIAGDGEDRSRLEEYLTKRGLTRCVVLLGNCPSERVVEEYGRANGFCLPSFSDPSPLSVIEALRMRLPLLISNRCGNHFEAVTDGSNGFVFDPDDPSSIRDAYRKFVAKVNDWDKMGAISEQIYNEKFEKNRVLSTFVAEFKRALSQGCP